MHADDVDAPSRPWAEPPPSDATPNPTPSTQYSALSAQHSLPLRPAAVELCLFTVARHPEAERDALQVVLVRREAEPYRGWWALPGALLEPGESLSDAAARVLAQQAGVAG